MKKTIGIILCIFTMVLPLFAGGRNQGTGAASVTNLIWYVARNEPQADAPAVLAEANKYLAQKLNVNLNIIGNDFGSYTEKMQLVIASQETFDMCFTANWINSFYVNVSRNAFLELDDLLNRYAAELKAQIPAAGWNAVKVKGRIYAVPNQTIWAYTPNLTMEKEYLDRYNINPGSIKDLAAVESLLALIKRDNPSMYPLGTSNYGVIGEILTYLGIEELAGSHIPGAILINDSSLKVINQYELPQFQDTLRLIRQWYQKGYIRPDAATITDTSADRLAGRAPVLFGGNNYPGVEIIDIPRHGGRKIFEMPFSQSWLTTGGIIANLTAVSRTSKAPDKAMQFLNLINTDKYLYNLISQGIEGKHYTKIDANFIRPIPNALYFPSTDWMYGNMFLAYLKEGQGLNDLEDTKKINATATPSPALGFGFDPAPIAADLVSVNSVLSEYWPSIGVGAVDPDRAMPEFIDKLRNAGSQRIITEIQRQLDAWKVTR